MLERQVMIGSAMKSMVSNQTVQEKAVPQDELLLIALARDGDVSSFNQLVRRYQACVYQTAFRVLGDVEMAGDATQDAFVSAFRHLRAFRGGSFKAWLMRIVTNACYDQLRIKQRQRSTSFEVLPAQGQNLPLPSESPQELAERSELGNLIQRGLASMPSDQRVTLVLADIEEFSYEEIAEITRANPGTVKSRLARARAHLRNFLLAQDNIVPRSYRYSQGMNVQTQPAN
jgi:RNA polymerase sigma-70 factor, ECF subfamily